MFRRYPGGGLIYPCPRFFCGGRCIMSSDLTEFKTSLTVILITLPIFFFSILPWFYFKIHIGIFIGLLVVSILAVIILVLAFFLASCMDPGIVPFNIDDSNNFHNRDNRKISIIHDSEKEKENKETVFHVNNQQIKFKSCYTCGHYRERNLGVSHCEDCNTCCGRFDHHCPWTGTCIGNRNYRFFFVFLTFSTISIFSLLLLCDIKIIWVIYDLIVSLFFTEDSQPVTDLSIIKLFCDLMPGIFLNLFLIVPLFFVALISLAHIILVTKNRTSKSAQYAGGDTNENYFQYIFRIFFSPIPRSLIRDDMWDTKSVKNAIRRKRRILQYMERKEMRTFTNNENNFKEYKKLNDKANEYLKERRSRTIDVNDDVNELEKIFGKGKRKRKMKMKKKKKKMKKKKKEDSKDKKKKKKDKK